MAMWTRIDNDPPEWMAPDGYPAGVIWVLVCLGMAAIGFCLAFP